MRLLLHMLTAANVKVLRRLPSALVHRVVMQASENLHSLDPKRPQMLPTGDRAIPYISFSTTSAHHQDRPTRDAYTAPAPVTKIGRQPIAASDRSENSH